MEFDLFTATTVRFNSIRDCLKIEINQTNYHGIVQNFRGNLVNMWTFCLLEMLVFQIM